MSFIFERELIVAGNARVLASRGPCNGEMELEESIGIAQLRRDNGANSGARLRGNEVQRIGQRFRNVTVL